MYSTEKKITSPPFDELNRLARKYTRRMEETDDLVQDLLLEAVRLEKDFTEDQFMAWAHGVLRNRAAFIGRTEARRKKREKAVQAKMENPEHHRPAFPHPFIGSLSPSLQITARLLNCGLNQKEMEYLLGISNQTLRQRFSQLRKKWSIFLKETGSGPEYGSNEPVPSMVMSRSMIHLILVYCEDLSGSHFTEILKKWWGLLIRTDTFSLFVQILLTKRTPAATVVQRRVTCRSSF